MQAVHVRTRLWRHEMSDTCARTKPFRAWRVSIRVLLMRRRIERTDYDIPICNEDYVKCNAQHDRCTNPDFCSCDEGYYGQASRKRQRGKFKFLSKDANARARSGLARRVSGRRVKMSAVSRRVRETGRVRVQVWVQWEGMRGRMI